MDKDIGQKTDRERKRVQLHSSAKKKKNLACEEEQKRTVSVCWTEEDAQKKRKQCLQSWNI